MSDPWQQFYLYRDNYYEFVLKTARDMRDSGKKVEVSDLTPIDTFHPAGHYGIDKFLSQIGFPRDSLILDIGCGMGGVSRYLASHDINVYGIDLLAHLLDAAKELSDIVGVGHRTEYHTYSITDNQLPSDKFDGAIIMAMLVLIKPRNIFPNIFQSIKNGGVLYIEDYVLVKEGELDDTDRDHLDTICFPAIRYKDELIKELQDAGFQVEILEDISEEWSKFAWARAESLWNKRLTTNDVPDIQFRPYGSCAPRLLSYLSNFSEEELRQKYPNTLNDIGMATVLNKNKLVSPVRIAARKVVN